MANDSLKQTQQALATAVRLGNAAPLGNYAPERLAVYARLVRNNTLGFIDRCFTETPAHLDTEIWGEVKERFVREGKAHSPYFQDISGEFLAFCQQHQIFTPNILALMDFEYTQLLAEVAMDNIPEEFEWDNDTVMQCSPLAYLKEYTVDFLSSNFQRLDGQTSQILIWRNAQFDVMYQSLTELDFWLLNCLQDQPLSFNQMLAELSELIEQNQEFSYILRQSWQHWINAEVIFPK